MRSLLEFQAQVRSIRCPQTREYLKAKVHLAIQQDRKVPAVKECIGLEARSQQQIAAPANRRKHCPGVVARATIERSHQQQGPDHQAPFSKPLLVKVKRCKMVILSNHRANQPIQSVTQLVVGEDHFHEATTMPHGSKHLHGG